MALMEPNTSDFIRDIISSELSHSDSAINLATRFPPEPNGYLHIGHAKSICLNFGIASEFGGSCNLRFDDTNPENETLEYVESIKRDIEWLGFNCSSSTTYTSDYFAHLYALSEKLIEMGKAYVDSLSHEEIRDYRGTLTEAGKHSPYRERSIGDNMDLFRRMKAGEFRDGHHVLRAKIDMGSPNLVMRDPVLYRIKHGNHYRTGNKWPIYPMYDFSHCLSDSIENITHSICTLEFANNRELYYWILDNVNAGSRPRQIEFARLNISYMVLSKRKLSELVCSGNVNGWDDPRMPTLSGLRRRGYTPESIKRFCSEVGVARRETLIDIALLEYCVRQDLNHNATRVMAVLRPLKIVIENYPEGQVEEIDAINHPERPEMGTRKVPFSRVLYIEEDDFQENPSNKFFRLAPGREVRLRYGYVIRCISVVKDPVTESIVELRCTYDPNTRGGNIPDGRKVKGTIHWVSAAQSLTVEIRLFDRLFTIHDPNDLPEGEDFTDYLNGSSLEVLSSSRLEMSMKKALPGQRYQFERQGYFCVDPDSSPGKLVLNRTVALRDTWAKS